MPADNAISERFAAPLLSYFQRRMRDRSQAEEAPELSPGGAPLAVLTLLGQKHGKVVAVVGHEPGLGALLTVCLLGDDGAMAIEMKKNAVACVSFDGSPRAGRAVLKWLATPRMLRGLRRD